MISRIQQKLLYHVDEHSLSYASRWQDLYTQLYTLNTQKMQEIAMNLLQDSGMSVRLLKGDRSLFTGDLQVGAEQTLLLYLHVPDLSPAAAASYIATTLVSYEAAIDTCSLAPGSLPANIKLVFDGWIKGQDSHGTIHDSAEYERLLQADMCIWYVPKPKAFATGTLPLLALGTKGSLGVELTAQAANVPIEAQYGAIAPNAAWQLLWALSTIKDRREDILIEGFYDELLSVEDDIIEALAHLAASFPSLSQSWGLQEPFLGLRGLQQYCAYFLTPTCTVSSIHSEQPIQGHESFIPQTASTQLDFQLVPRQDPIDLYAKLQSHLLDQNMVQTRLLRSTQPAYTSLSDSFVNFVIQATTASYGQPPQILPLIVPDPSSHLLQATTLPFVIIPLPFLVTEPQEFYAKDYKESLVQCIQQETIIMAGATLANEKG